MNDISSHRPRKILSLCLSLRLRVGLYVLANIMSWNSISLRKVPKSLPITVTKNSC